MDSGAKKYLKNMREITEKHINTALKILASEKYWRGEVFKNNPEKLKRKVTEIDYCERLVKALFEDRQEHNKQPKLI